MCVLILMELVISLFACLSYRDTCYSYHATCLSLSRHCFFLFLLQPPLHSLYDTFMSLLLANRGAARATNDMDVDGVHRSDKASLAIVA
jgi:hypothetical protein